MFNENFDKDTVKSEQAKVARSFKKIRPAKYRDNVLKEKAAYPLHGRV